MYNVHCFTVGCILVVMSSILAVFHSGGCRHSTLENCLAPIVKFLFIKNYYGVGGLY